jgi:prepilin-type N-terminal cleavage/methylation domain-containing protein
MTPRRVSGARRRTGFTLWEMTVVLMVLAVATGLAAPALVSFGTEKPRTSADRLTDLLGDARRLAITSAVDVRVTIDPTTGHYRVDSIGSFGMGLVAKDSLELGLTDALETTLPRLRYLFRASGTAFGDSVVVRGVDSTRAVFVDRFSGVAYAVAR